MKLNQKISTKFFVLANIVIVISALVFFGSIYYILYLSDQPPQSLLGERLLTQKPKTLIIDLNQPEADSLSFDSSILLSGKTLPNVEVLVFSDTSDFVIKSKSDGTFTLNLELEEGVNQISVVVFDANGESKTIKRSVYYSKEKM
ncbi:hypothetical protein A3B45_05505 [Candidatus Daviesbacteria bacterium RIFCSPLOWO2_01_FULL_39_12]|uniref:Bacterial Ig-like domain-containing protein n=1 Tax=Candidatus Daviesbacteria bacterium RIFCSPLOWO2_01_FULL_39_12 TaxID=1797785 RepID=A0A1F5KTQ7_9BACT|nr:MAG: hypothetical protein A3B45_05505 [Candidatus Daviesbacteria bacterium RIFCSPLOWO2_01_FULL_39_12]